jgi:hypothetical protein
MVSLTRRAVVDRVLIRLGRYLMSETERAFALFVRVADMVIGRVQRIAVIGIGRTTTS